MANDQFAQEDPTEQPSGSVSRGETVARNYEGRTQSREAQ